jgi:hypothetical protein
VEHAEKTGDEEARRHRDAEKAFFTSLGYLAHIDTRLAAGTIGGPLKFFTTAWHQGDLPDAEADQVFAEYEAHLAALGPNLPDDARRLSADVSLHDALVLRVERGSSSLEVQFRAGNNQSGYFTVTLWYGSVALSDADEQFLTGATGRRDIELLYDEFDAPTGSGSTGCCLSSKSWDESEGEADNTTKWRVSGISCVGHTRRSAYAPTTQDADA